MAKKKQTAKKKLKPSYSPKPRPQARRANLLTPDDTSPSPDPHTETTSDNP